jgi:hypothetical protein
MITYDYVKTYQKSSLSIFIQVFIQGTRLPDNCTTAGFGIPNSLSALTAKI